MDSSTHSQMKAPGQSKTVSRTLFDLAPKPIGWSELDLDLSRKKFMKIIGGLVCSALAVGALGFVLVLFPQHANVIWFFQLIALLVLLGFVLAALACARQCFFDPLEHVRRWASEIRQGDFSARVPVAMEGGFVTLADDINRLAEWLESLANDAEEQIRQQAERLALKNQSLKLLYDASSLINRAPGNEELVGQYLNSLQTMLEARVARAYLEDPSGSRLVSTIGGANRREKRPGLGPENGESAVVEGLEKIMVPLCYKDRSLGRYELFVDADNPMLGSELMDVLPDIGRHLGMAIEKTRLEQEAIGLSAMKERAQMANELHDSLAQTLAGLKFQVRVLDETIGQGEESAVWSQLEKVEASLEEATRELRSLIAQFRGDENDHNATKSIDHVVAQFKRRYDMELFFHNHWGNVQLPAVWERQVARVIQEALANAYKHSQASTLRVLLRRVNARLLEVIVEDDGVGFDQPAVSNNPGEHIGLSIMRERMEQIGGELSIDSEPGEGTRILLQLHLGDRNDYPVASAAS